MSVSLAVEGLSVARGGRLLLEGLSFRAEPGSFFEIRGPNGSGKTSLLRCLAGLLEPAHGRIRIEGVEERQLALHLLGHRDGLKGALSARAHARFWAGLLGGVADVEGALETVGLGRVADLPARVLSQGQARRLALCRLLVAPRPVWLLDEPAAGLDAAGKTLLDRCIATHRGSGGVVIAALHESLGASGERLELGA